MSGLLDEFQSLIGEDEEINTGNNRESLIKSYHSFIGSSKESYCGVSMDALRKSMYLCSTEYIPQEHVMMTLDMGSIKDISGRKLTVFEIPAFVEELKSIENENNSGFGFNEFGRNSLEIIEIPKNISIIHDNTFAMYRKLHKITFKNDSTLEFLGNSTFAGCDSLEEVNLAKCSKLKTLGKKMFYYSGVKVLRINPNTTYFEQNTFEQCRLDTVFIGREKIKYSDFYSSLAENNFEAFWM